MKKLVLSTAALLALTTAAFAGGHHHLQQHWGGSPTFITAVGGAAQANSSVGVKFTGGAKDNGFGQIVNSSWARGGNALAGGSNFSGYMW